MSILLPSPNALTTSLIPSPQQVKVREGKFRLDQSMHWAISGLEPVSVELFARAWPNLRVELSNGPGFTAALSMDSPRKPAPSPPLPVPTLPESYVLDVGSDAVTIHANDAPGLWWGLQTLRQLREGSEDGTIPCLWICDWPVIRRRGLHVDLKGYLPHIDRLKEMFELLSLYKINTVMLEVENKFDFTTAPGVAVEGALTGEEMRDLGALAAATHIEIIPNIPCLAHVDYVLKHSAYHDLREDGHAYQYCPRHPGSLKLWKAMAEELMDCFPASGYFHVGADEVTHLGKCSRCKDYSRTSSFIQHVAAAMSFVRERGCTPIFWDDMLRNIHGNFVDDDLAPLRVLQDQAVVMYWAYGYEGKDNEFPSLPEYVEAGAKVWGASALSGSGPRWFQNTPLLLDRAPNLSAWARAAETHGLECVMATGWTRIRSADPPSESPEACWVPILYAAESMWCGDGPDPSTFAQSALHSMFGVAASDMAQFTLDGVCDATVIEDMAAEFDPSPTPRHPQRYQLLRAAMLAAGHERKRYGTYTSAYEILHPYHGMIGHQLAEYCLVGFEKNLANFKRSLEQASEAMRLAMAPFYHQASIDECLRSRFGRDQVLIDECQAMIDRTQRL